MADRWLTYRDIAALMGLSEASGARTVAGWRSTGRPVHNPLPEPGRTQVERGHAVPQWRESVIREWMARRPGHGGRVARSGD